jgi:hypothetical protein
MKDIPSRLNAAKALNDTRKRRCEASTKAGRPCHAPVVERGLCFFHAFPARAVDLGRRGGRNNKKRIEHHDLRERSLKTLGDVASLLEETINQVRFGQIDLRASNAIGFLAGTLLKALEKSRIEERLGHLEAILGHKTDRNVVFDFRPTGENNLYEELHKASEND